ncbi:peptidase inhibitor 16-like [Sycon ciliatum]|uniref:peptidase inhibitor 16-like n=1 Tax=Sycon ciliatum TaxID=27933 RepID=UPI0020A85D83|eukprot:scpid76614/ scgid20951/ Peptidase inhibitor 16; Cysteine-rich protease inhibitor
MFANTLGALLLATCSHAMLTSLEKEELVGVHNALRGEVLPQASNMQKMLWDDQLATSAQEHSSRCVWAPNQLANAEAAASFPEGVGENLAFSFNDATTAEVNPVRFIHEWFAESAFYNLSSDSCAPKETCKHYKQLVWSSSHAIGCGIYTCQLFDFFGVSLPNATLFSCLYGAAGNTATLKPYSEGTPCSECPSRSESCEASLCVLSLTANASATAGSVDLSGPGTVGNGSAEAPQGNISAPPLVAMPPPAVEIGVDAPTTPAPTLTPSLLPNHCEAPATATDREDCWRSAWLLWTQKYNQWAAGQCSQSPTSATSQTFPGLL